MVHSPVFLAAVPLDVTVKFISLTKTSRFPDMKLNQLGGLARCRSLIVELVKLIEPHRIGRWSVEFVTIASHHVCPFPLKHQNSENVLRCLPPWKGKFYRDSPSIVPPPYILTSNPPHCQKSEEPWKAYLYECPVQ